MDFSAIINRLNQLTAFMNNVIANSKKILELPSETAGEKFVAVWNSLTETTQKMNLSELLDYVNSINTRITNYGTIDRDVNEFTFNIGFEWIIEGISYANTSAIVHDIALATTGENRIDIAVLNASNGIDIVTGFETAGTAEQPLPPPNTILLKIFVVDDTTVDAEDPPAFSLTVTEVGGISVSDVMQINFDGATVTDDGSGVVTITITGGGGSSEIKEQVYTVSLAQIGAANFEDDVPDKLIAYAQANFPNRVIGNLYRYEVLESIINFSMEADWASLSVTNQATFETLLTTAGASAITITEFSLVSDVISCNLEFTGTNLDMNSSSIARLINIDALAQLTTLNLFNNDITELCSFDAMVNLTNLSIGTNLITTAEWNKMVTWVPLSAATGTISTSPNTNSFSTSTTYTALVSKGGWTIS